MAAIATEIGESAAASDDFGPSPDGLHTSVAFWRNTASAGGAVSVVV